MPPPHDPPPPYPTDAYEDYWAALDAGPAGGGPADPPTDAAPADAYAAFLASADV